MSTTERNPSERPGNQSLDAVTGERRRETLAALVGRSGSATERELAAELAAAERDVSPAEVAPDEVRSVRIELYHSHLPALEDAGLVSWDRSAETVAAADHPALDDDGFEALLRTDDERWNAVRSCVTDEDKRAVLAALESRDGRVSRATLARELAARDAAGAPSDDAVDAAAVRLHHVHLPKLDDAGLVDYDADDAAAALRDDVTVPVRRLLAAL